MQTDLFGIGVYTHTGYWCPFLFVREAAMTYVCMYSVSLFCSKVVGLLEDRSNLSHSKRKCHNNIENTTTTNNNNNNNAECHRLPLDLILSCSLFPFFFSPLCRTLWGECSDCDGSGSAEWLCPQAAQVFNDLAGNPSGSSAMIIETDGGTGDLLWLCKSPCSLSSYSSPLKIQNQMTFDAAASHHHRSCWRCAI